MQGHTVSGAHVIYTALGAMGVMLIASLYWGRSFREQRLSLLHRVCVSPRALCPGC